MKYENLISKQGFIYMRELFESGCSNSYIREWLDYIELNNKKISESNRKLKVRKQRKKHQIKGIIEIVGAIFETKSCLDVCCGDGEITKALATRYEVPIVGIDINKKLIKKLNQDNSYKNLNVYHQDAFSNPPKSDTVLALHACGSLTDRVIDIAVENKADVLCVPCCYSRISEPSLPRSSHLQDFRDYFRGLRAKVSANESRFYQNNGSDLSLDLSRAMLNYDRMLFLQERGYKVSLINITPRKDPNERFYHSSLRTAIVGLLN